MNNKYLTPGFAYLLKRREENSSFFGIYIGHTSKTIYSQYDQTISDLMSQIGDSRPVFIDKNMQKLYIADENITIKEKLTQIINEDTVSSIMKQSEIFMTPKYIELMPFLSNLILKFEYDTENEKPNFSCDYYSHLNMLWLDEKNNNYYFLNDFNYEYKQKSNSYHLHEPALFGFHLYKNTDDILIFKPIGKILFNEFCKKFDLIGMGNFSFSDITSLKSNYFKTLYNNNFQSFFIRNHNDTINFKHKLTIEEY